MIIHSKFRDYYDNALMYGHDAHIRYIRKTETIKNTLDKELFEMYPSMKSIGYTQTPFYLGFCGRLYAGLRLEYGYDSAFDRTFYNPEEFKKYVFNIKDRSLRAAETDNYNRIFYSWNLSRRMAGDDVSQMFFGDREETELFFELGTPVFMITREEIITNPDISKFEFFRVFPAPQAFQEIDMFLSGVLGAAHPPMVEISDESMKQKKGFNEWSFKTLPTKKRK